MTIDWTRIAVRLHNEARAAFEEGKLSPSITLYREALAALPTRERPATHALIRYGLAQALAASGARLEARRHLARSLGLARRLVNREAEEACRRLAARIAYLEAAGGRLGAARERELDLVLAFGVRPAQHVLGIRGRPPRLRIELWARLPLAALRAARRLPAARRTLLFLVDRLIPAGPSGLTPAQGRLPAMHLAIGRVRGQPPRTRLDVVEDLGGPDLIARRLEVVGRAGGFGVVRETLLPV